MARRTGPSVTRAIASFQEAIALDPEYAPAHASLASAYALAITYRYDIGMDGYAAAAQAMRRLAGIGDAVFHPADYAILNGSISEPRMGRAFSIHTFFGHLGSALAPATILFLAALTDGRIGKALREIHSRPGAAWSVAGLAEKAGMSRSAFARRFQELMNMTPMHYVAHWRMQRAWDELNAGSQSVSALAEKYGYGSEVSFRKAFRKHIGKGPGAVRRESTVRTSPQTAKKMTLRYGQTET